MVAVLAQAPCAFAAGGEQGAVLLFTIGMHIEPQGTTAQGYRSGKGADYRQQAYFDRHVEDIRTVAAMVERHGGRITIQAQSPFTGVAIERAHPVLSELAARGHEMALHFHEDAHLGSQSASRSVEEWCRVMAQEIELVRQASGVTQVSYWSGGNLYPSLFEAASCAGLSVNSDWKNPRTQQTPLELVGVNPWRPAGGTDGADLTLLLQHDPEGPVVFLPEGAYDTTDFASSRRGSDPETYFDFLARTLERSLAAATVDRVNVFHFTVHPGEFRGDPGAPFDVIERFLTEHVDPLVASGSVRWATLSEMAWAYEAWEQPGEGGTGRNPRRHLRPGSGTGEVDGTMSFIVNVHDWTHPDESAATLRRLVDLFERNGVTGDFYLTAEVTRALQGRHPEVIERLKGSSMTISYHVRAPHPLWPGFGQRLRGLDEAALYETLRDYETYALDLETGELDRARAGGYALVARAFGRKPVVASVPDGDPTIREIGQRVYRDLGARMTVVYHESGAAVEQPFEYVNGLLIRPSDFSITRTTAIDGTDNFWWNRIGSDDRERYRPAALLAGELARWRDAGMPRDPFVTALIHENNFVRSGPEGWTSIYFTIAGGRRGDPLPPPWDLGAADPSRLRSQAEQDAIWAAYEELVAYATGRLRAATSQELVEQAVAQRDRFDLAKLGATERDITYCTAAGVPLKLDLYYPSTSGPWPVTVFVHGGGWSKGDKSGGAPEIAPLRDAGFLVAAANYRLAPEHPFPAMIEDVACAVRFLRAHAGELGVDPSRVGAWGSSAGGHLVSMLGSSDPSAGFAVGEHLDQSGRVQAVVSQWGPTDLTVPFPGGYAGASRVFAGFDAALASPITYVTPDDPPFLFVHGEQDPLVPISQSQVMLDRLLATGVSAELLAVRNAGHSLAPAGGAPDPARGEVTRRVVEFFQQRLR